MNMSISILGADLTGWGSDGPGQQHRPARQGAGIDEVGAGFPVSDQRQHPQKSELHGADGEHTGESEEATDSGSV